MWTQETRIRTTSFVAVPLFLGGISLPPATPPPLDSPKLRNPHPYFTRFRRFLAHRRARLPSTARIFDAGRKKKRGYIYHSLLLQAVICSRCLRPYHIARFSNLRISQTQRARCVKVRPHLIKLTIVLINSGPYVPLVI